jgi:hypothetical protein
MNSKFQPSEDTFEDVEGHGKNSPVAPEDEDDVEGHGEGSPVASDDDEDTEGHGARANF